MARPIERPKHHYKPFEFTINVEDAFDYLDKFKNTPDYPKAFPLHVPNKYKILGDRLESKFGVSTVEARKIVGMWFDRNKSIKTENMKKVIKLTEKDIEGLVKKVIKEEKNKTLNESLDEYQRRELEDLHDDLLYLTPGYSGRNDLGTALSIYREMKAIVGSSDVSEEAQRIMRRIDFDISGLDGIIERVTQLYVELTGDTSFENI